MSRYIRPFVPGATIFFTVALAVRGSNLLVHNIDNLRAAVGLTRRERPFHVDAWVVLPDHMHCIWTLPEGDSDYANRWGAIKARFSHSLPSGHRRPSHQTRREKGIWQRRYWEHHIRNRADFDRHLKLCWQSPVQLKLVKHPDQWAFSSFHVAKQLAQTTP